MEQKDRTPEEYNLALASALEILPILIRNYQVFSPLLEEVKENFRVKSGRLLDALPSIAESLRKLDQTTTETLSQQLFEILPEFESLFPQGKQ